MNENMHKTQGKRLLNIEETAYYLGLSPRTIYNGVAPKSKAPFPIKPKRIGKLVRFDVRDLDEYINTLGN
jgi:predicted DNA-binding transcriptional regulator AlpA